MLSGRRIGDSVKATSMPVGGQPVAGAVRPFHQHATASVGEIVEAKFGKLVGPDSR